MGAHEGICAVVHPRALECGRPKMATLLEVIVTSVAEGIEAEAGGANRLELVRQLDAGGLTPDLNLAANLLAAVRIPIRAMVREEATMSAGGAEALSRMQKTVAEFAGLPLDGIVAGFVKNRRVDAEAMRAILAAAPKCRVTFHRAFDEVTDPLAAIEELKHVPQVDRILTSGGNGSWPQRKKRLNDWQRAASPAIKILLVAGLDAQILADLRREPGLFEVHVGRAARVPRSVGGIVRREAVRTLKSALA